MPNPPPWGKKNVVKSVLCFRLSHVENWVFQINAVTLHMNRLRAADLNWRNWGVCLQVKMLTITETSPMRKTAFPTSGPGAQSLQ